MSKDYYRILGVEKNASAEDLKKAFRKLAHEHHPDKGGNTEKFKEINEAYQVLNNPEKRAQYDRFGSDFQHGQAGGGFSGFNQGGMNMNFDDLSEMFGGFGDIFGFGGGRSQGRRSSRGNDLEMVLTVDFLEAVFGADKEIKYQRVTSCSKCQGSGGEPGAKVETCKTCNGRGRVYKIQHTILGSMQVEAACTACQGEGKIFSQKCSACRGQGVERAETKLKVRIPAGINNGESIRLAGQGDLGTQGASAGDLYLRLRINPHKNFVRDGYDIRTKEQINIRQAILGDKIEVETVDGPVKLKIPEGTQSGTVFKLKESGVPKLHGRGRGDQLVEVVVKIPKDLNRNDKKLIEALNI